METNETFWHAPVRTSDDASRIVKALASYEIRNAVRDGAQAHPELPIEAMRDRLIETLAYRIHALFVKCWPGDPPDQLDEDVRPALSGAGAQVITLADPFKGWAHPSMTVFRVQAKAGNLLGNVDLELAAMWVLRERMNLGDTSRFSIIIDPSQMAWLEEKLFTAEHIARRQAFDLSSQTPEGATVAPRPRF